MENVKVESNAFIPMPVALVGCLLKGKAWEIGKQLKTG